jgi:hypothetical protein
MLMRRHTVAPRTQQRNGSQIMPKPRQVPKHTYSNKDNATVDLEPLPPASEDTAAPLPPAVPERLESQDSRAPSAVKEPIRYPDPRTLISVSLSPHQGGPSMQLLRSHRYKQLQIRFERQQPDDQYLARLKEAGWTDRSETEGIWTKQIPPGEWRPVADAERLFKEIANAIRKDKGLEPVLQEHSVA